MGKKKRRTVTLNGVTYDVVPYLEGPGLIALTLDAGYSLIHLEDLTTLGLEWEYDK